MNHALRDIHAQVVRSGLWERISRGAQFMVIHSYEGFGAEFLLGPHPVKTEEPEDGTPPVTYPEIIDLRGLAANTLKKRVSAIMGETSEGNRAVVLVSQANLNDWLPELRDERPVDVIGPERLAYEPDEIRQFLIANFPDAIVTHDLVNEVAHVTGGWPLLVDFVLDEATSLEELRFFLHSRTPSAKALSFVQEKWEELTTMSLETSMVFGVVRHLDAELLGHVLESSAKAEDMLANMKRASFLNPVDLRRMQHPLLRDSIEQLAMARWPAKMKRVHHKTAEFLESHEPMRRAPDIVAHYVQAGLTKEAMAHLEKYGDTIVDKVSSVRLIEWLSAIESDLGTLPMRSSAILARARAVVGEWEGARTALKQCEALLKSAELSPGERAIGYARVASVRAHMAWLKGVPTEANTYCQRAMTALHQANRAAGAKILPGAKALQLDLLELRATLTLQSGRYLKAREILAEVIELAEENGQDSARMNAMKDLANLSMREGQLKKALKTYNECAQLLNRRVHTELFSAVHTQEAQCHRLLGQYEQAHQSIHKAFTVRRLVSPEGMTHTLLTMAQIDGAMGHEAEAETLFRRAYDHAEDTANSALRVSVRLWLCEHLRRTPAGLKEAEALLQGLDSFVGNIERSYPVLAALKEMISGLITQGNGEIAEAIVMFSKAQAIFKKLHIPYYESLCYLHTANAHYERSLLGELSDSSRIRTFADKACTIANQNTYVFGRKEKVIPLLETAAGIGAIETSRYLSRIRGIKFVPQEEKPVKPQMAIQAPGQNCIITQEGLKYVEEGELEALMANMNQEILNIIIAGGKTNFIHKGVKQTGDLKRIIVPLLRTLLSSAGEEVKAPKLAEAVWGAGEYNQKARTRLKVAISRLRTLLGSDGKHLTTIPGKGPNRAENTGYRMEKELEFLWLEKINVG